MPATAIKQPVKATAVNPYDSDAVELAKQYAALRVKLDAAEAEVKAMKAEAAFIELQLTGLVEFADIKPPYRFDGVGMVNIVNELSVTTANKDMLLHSLSAMGMEDLITQQVNAQTLKSFVKERMAANRQLPQGINIYPLQKLRFTKQRQ